MSQTLVHPETSHRLDLDPDRPTLPPVTKRIYVDPGDYQKPPRGDEPQRIMTCDYCPRPDFDIRPATPEESAFRHGGWERHRWLTYEALRRRDRRAASLYRFIHCGSGSIIQVSADRKEARAVSNTCRNRMCVPCRARQARVIRGNLFDHCARRRREDRAFCLRSITLTLRHSDQPLKHQLTRLLKCFAKLRKQKSVKKIFKGGAAVVEIKRSVKDSRWHPHLHILSEGSYVAFNDLKAAWRHVTGDSDVVYVQAVNDAAREIDHHCKYITKAADCSVYSSPATLDEYIAAVRGQRTVITFGTWRGVRLSRSTASDQQWHTWGDVHTLLLLVKQRDPEALKIYGLIIGDSPAGAEKAADSS